MTKQMMNSKSNSLTDCS